MEGEEIEWERDGEEEPWSKWIRINKKISCMGNFKK